MEQQKKKRTAGICLTLAGGICWGLSGCFGQYLFQKKDITADWLVMVRLLLAGVLLVLMGFFADEKTDGGYLEKSCGQKAALDFFCFWYAELSVYLFCGHPIFQCRHGNGVAVLGAFADFGGCVLQGKALAS